MIDETGCNLSLSERHVALREGFHLARVEPHPDADFDPARHEKEVQARLTDLVMDAPAIEFLEFLTEMGPDDRSTLRDLLYAKRLPAFNVAAGNLANADLANFIDRMFVKWNRRAVERDMENQS